MQYNNKLNVRDKVKINRLQKLVDKIAEDVKPTEGEIRETIRYSNSLMERLREVLPKNVEIILAGSVARGTQIRGSSDIDIFLQYPRTVDEKEMEKEAVEVGKGIVDKKTEYFLINYAEHPYIKIINRHSRISADIVPAFKIKDVSEMASSVDRTPLHNLFINSHLSRKQKGEVRALKYFLRQHNIYGAEARIGGFSGYLCEIMIYSFGGFVNLLSYFSHLKLPVAIVPINKKIISIDKEIIKIKKKFEKEFVVIDPTDPSRNVAAAVSLESLARFVLVSRTLLGNPSRKTFYGKGYSDLGSKKKVNDLIKKYGLELHTLVIKTDDISEDILWPQVTKLKVRISKLMCVNHLAPLLILQNLKKGEAMICIFTNRIIINSFLDEGPSIFMQDGANSFYKKYVDSNHMFIVGDKLKVMKKSKFRTVDEILKNVLTDKKFGFPSHLHKNNVKLLEKLDEKYAKCIWEEINQIIV